MHLHLHGLHRFDIYRSSLQDYVAQLNFIFVNETSAVAWLQTDRWALEHAAATQIVSHHKTLLQLIKPPYIWSQSEIE